MKKDSKKTHYILFNTLLAWLENKYSYFSFQLDPLSKTV